MAESVNGAGASAELWPAGVRPPLEIIPLGGVGQFGLNMTAVRLGDRILVIDAGIMFPSPENPGVDLILPDISFLAENQNRVDAVILTHGHEDHMGAVSHVLETLAVPIYGTRLTLGLVRRRLEERGLLSDASLNELVVGETLSLGPFRIEVIGVAHSIADSVGLAIETPLGTIVHTGDFKLDPTPVVGPPTDLDRFRHHGKKGVLCLLSDSTNAEVPGTTGSENSVGPAFEEIVRDAPGRVFLTCFTSSTHRMQLAIDTATKYGRSVSLIGRSMTDNTQVAIDLGHLRVPAGLLVSVSDLNQLPRNRQFILTAGSQGEPFSALSQIAADTRRSLSVEPGDRLILSARVIPGNERAVSRVLNDLFRLGASVYYRANAQVHVSGHGSADELAALLDLVRPRYFMPIHGEWRQMYHHAQIARRAGVEADRIFLTEPGDVLRFDDDGAAVSDKVAAGRVYVDVSGLGHVDECILRERRKLSVAGVLIPMVSLSSSSEPDVSDILAHGFIESPASDALLSEAHDVMLRTIRGLSPEERSSGEAVEDAVEAALNRFFRKRTQRRPVIVPVVVESGG